MDVKHAALVQHSPAGILSVDLGFRVQSWNPACERIFGYRAEEVLGQPPLGEGSGIPRGVVQEVMESLPNTPRHE